MTCHISDVGQRPSWSPYSQSKQSSASVYDIILYSNNNHNLEGGMSASDCEPGSLTKYQFWSEQSTTVTTPECVSGGGSWLVNPPGPAPGHRGAESRHRGPGLRRLRRVQWPAVSHPQLSAVTSCRCRHQGWQAEKLTRADFHIPAPASHKPGPAGL